MAASVNPKSASKSGQLSFENHPAERDVEAVLADRRLTPGARILYHALHRHIVVGRRPHPTQRQLARITGVSARSVRTLVAELERRGLLRVVQLGCNRPNRYHLLRPR